MCSLKNGMEMEMEVEIEMGNHWSGKDVTIGGTKRVI